MGPVFVSPSRTSHSPEPSTTAISSPINSYTSASIVGNLDQPLVELLASGDGGGSEFAMSSRLPESCYLVYHWPIPGLRDWFALSLGCLKPG